MNWFLPILFVALAGLAALAGCAAAEADETETANPYAMKCGWAQKNQGIMRCENAEVVCYRAHYPHPGLSCFQKAKF